MGSKTRTFIPELLTKYTKPDIADLGIVLANTTFERVATDHIKHFEKQAMTALSEDRMDDAKEYAMRSRIWSELHTQITMYQSTIEEK